jgi:ATP-binding cassette, subfamily G (WHITE), member 2
VRFRSAKNFTNAAWLGPRIMDKLIFSIVILTLYLNIGKKFTADNVVNMGASLFMWCTLPAFGAASYVPSIVLERRLFIRERADGLYTVFAYLFAKLLEEVALTILTSLVFSSYVFAGVGYAGSYVVFWLVYFITMCNGIVLAYLVAALSPNMDVANAALPAYVVTLLFFAGQLITYSSMPPWWYWYSTIDFLRYSWGALMVNQFEYNDIVFSQDGQTVLQYFGLSHVDKWSYIGYDSLFFVAYGILAYLALSYIKHEKR